MKIRLNMSLRGVWFCGKCWKPLDTYGMCECDRRKKGE